MKTKVVQHDNYHDDYYDYHDNYHNENHDYRDDYHDAWTVNLSHLVHLWKHCFPCLIRITAIPISECKKFIHSCSSTCGWQLQRDTAKNVMETKILNVRKFTIFCRVNNINIVQNLNIDDSGHYQYRYRIDLKIRLSLSPGVYYKQTVVGRSQ